MKLTPAGLAGMIDHTLLKPEATIEQIVVLCREAVAYGFKAVCLNPCYVPFACRELDGAQVVVCPVIGFPLGASASRNKAFEVAQAVNTGAKEVDMVMNIGFLKSGMLKETGEDMRAVVTAAKKENPAAIVKVILETCLLTNEEIKTACCLAQEAGCDFVKTSTGFSISGARIEDIKLMRKTVGPDMGIKAAGGIKTLEDAVSMLQAGATRLGMSAGVSIMKQLTIYDEN